MRPEYTNHCPARDRNTGQCFGLTWFKHKHGPGKYILCDGDCSARREWEERENKRIKGGI